MAKRTAGKPKPKSIKSKSINKNSKRKLAVLGKQQKKGYAGDAIMYMTRSQAIRKLGLSLKDFRRICILKGIYPREPKKKLNKSTTYYHAKDISYIAREPIIGYFRQMKSFLKKITRSYGRNELSEVKRKWEHKPEVNLDHLVKERYPTFASALTDMDDALSLVHLFALLPAKNKIRAQRTKACQRLVREWDMYVIKSKSLRKCFISIKGIYYQAEVMGEKITWLVPHKFSQELPDDVDYRVMLTFLDFYEVFLGFVLFRLYATLGLKYPPAISEEKDELGAYLSSVNTEPLPAIHGDQEKTMEEEEEEKQQQQQSETNQAAMKTALASISSHTSSSTTTTTTTVVVADQEEEQAEYQLEEAFAEDEEARALLQKQKALSQFTTLFADKVFFLSREVPRENMEFLILCFGGKVGWEGEGSPYAYTSPSITHVVMDRPAVREALPNRDYIQPQWLFDSVNNGLLLPVERYVPGQALPPHLSPFVDNDAEGYTPEYQKEIDRLKSGVQEEEEKEDDSAKQAKKELAEEEKALRFAKEIEMEAKGEEPEEEEEKGKEEEEEEEEEKEEEEEEELKLTEEKERQMSMMNKRHRHLYEIMEKSANKKEKRISTLKQKAKRASAGVAKKN